MCARIRTPVLARASTLRQASHLVLSDLSTRRTLQEALQTNFNLQKFKDSTILYGFLSDLTPTAMAPKMSTIHVGLTSRTAKDRAAEYAVDCVDPDSIVHFLFDDESPGLLIASNAYGVEAVVHHLVSLCATRDCSRLPRSLIDPRPANSLPALDLQLENFPQMARYSKRCKCGKGHREFFVSNFERQDDELAEQDYIDLKMMQIAECFVYLTLEWQEANR